MIDALLPQAATVAASDHTRWLAWCLERAERYPVVLDEYRTASPINPYVALETVFASMPEDALVVAGDGWAGVGTAQTVRIRGNQRAYSNSGVGSMGHGFPAALGAALSSPGRPVICIDGDGSLQMNIQELQTAIHYRLPVRLVVLDNGGYHSIRQTQERFFPDGLVGFDAASGVSFPDIARIATAYGIPNVTVDSVDGIRRALEQAASADGPAMVIIKVNRDQEFAPKAASRALPNGTMESAPLEDLGPFLPREEHADNGVVSAACAVAAEGEPVPAPRPGQPSGIGC
jgi:acetolactate synthase-1/2/3 large subunit